MKRALYAALGVVLTGTTVVSANALSNQTAPRIAIVGGQGAPAGPKGLSQSQAVAQLEQQGYANVTNPQEDFGAVWRASAVKDGRFVNVSIDAKGRIISTNQ